MKKGISKNKSRYEGFNFWVALLMALFSIGFSLFQYRKNIKDLKIQSLDDSVKFSRQYNQIQRNFELQFRSDSVKFSKQFLLAQDQFYTSIKISQQEIATSQKAITYADSTKQFQIINLAYNEFSNIYIFCASFNWNRHPFNKKVRNFIIRQNFQHLINKGKYRYGECDTIEDVLKLQLFPYSIHEDLLNAFEFKDFYSAFRDDYILAQEVVRILSDSKILSEQLSKYKTMRKIDEIRMNPPPNIVYNLMNNLEFAIYKVLPKVAKYGKEHNMDLTHYKDLDKSLKIWFELDSLKKINFDFNFLDKNSFFRADTGYSLE